MIGWLWRIIVGRFSSCEHQWEIFTQFRLRDENNAIIGRLVVLRCQKCGKLKNFKIES